MYISSPFFALTLTKLIGMLKSKTGKPVHPALAAIIEFSEASRKKLAYTRAIKFDRREHPMPEDLIAALFQESLRQVANNNHAHAAKLATEASFAARATHKDIHPQHSV